LGEWAPIDRYENEVGTTYYVFAAPHFLSSQYRMPLRLSYNEAVKEVTKLKNWHGFDGTNYKTDAELYSALSDKSYKGGWFIPPIELLRGVRSGHYTEAFKNHLYNVKHCGKFRKDFFDDAPNVLSCTYYSSFGGTVDIMHFGSGRFSQAFDYKSGYYCRPMRVVPAP
ncbi:MAG: hypothetical protein PHE27_03155, partial [Alphaproteobacteria bacterium]|nr:hypothetical protein [Alphaproteobacteria bacterium]